MCAFQHLTWKPPREDFRRSTKPYPQPIAVKQPEDTGFSRIQAVATRKKGTRIAIEICCGHAGLTAALWNVGFEATGVDWIGNRHRPTVPIVRADLTTPEGQDLVWKLIEDKKVAYVHMGPPCGTFTRAREIPVPQWKQALGAPAPKPLRTTEEPEGIHYNNFSDSDKLKIQKGNQIAWFCAKIAEHCLQHGILFSIENPRNSIL